MSAGEIWTRFLGYLTDLGASPSVIIAVSAATGLTLVSSGWALWLAFALRDAGDPASDDAT